MAENKLFLASILTDYLEMSENQINSLMMRYDTLHATNQSLVADLEGNAAMVCGIMTSRFKGARGPRRLLNKVVKI